MCNCFIQIEKHVMKNYNLANKLIISALLEKFEIAIRCAACCVPFANELDYIYVIKCRLKVEHLDDKYKCLFAKIIRIDV